MKSRWLLFTIIFAGLNLNSFSQSKQLLNFHRTSSPPIIDGNLNDIAWKNTNAVSGFVQSEPYWGEKPKFQTEVKVMYDNHALYISARMHDTHPDSINKQLGLRDNDLHADYFAIEFDPFNRMQESFYFQVTASGVQSEWKRSDETYNAVWKSKVQIDSLGWTCEMAIPFSAFSFLNAENQIWKIQFFRYIRRNREISTWSLVKQMDDNDIQYWAQSDNLIGITPPLRLFLQPYINATIVGYPNDNGKTTWDQSTKGGLDLKWGINQSYNLEMTLLPDFSQVQSDNLIKNLSAFETVYSDFRPFFNESISFFQKGGLLYTRRIGKRPSDYYSIEDQIDSNERIISNPATSPLINAFKIYGRNKYGLAVGFFNAITNKTEAIIEDQDKAIRKIQTEPLTNYSLFVIEKAFKNKSNIYFSNANTLRLGNEIQANVSALGGSYYFLKGGYRISLTGGTSRRSKVNQEFWDKSADDGYKYDFSLAKVNGKIIYSFNRYFKDNQYNPNDMGVNFVNNEASNNITITHRIVNPFWKLLNFQQTLTIDYANRISTKKETAASMRYSIFSTTKKHLTFWSGITLRPIKVYDYYEARNSDFFYLAPRYLYGNINFSSDYRRPFALDGGYAQTHILDYSADNHIITITPVLRIGNRTGMRLSNSYSIYKGQIGYAGKDENNEIVFGKRNVKTYENSYTINYMLKNNLAIVFRGRYYWSQGTYSLFYHLQSDGNITEPDNNITENHDFTYSVFNIDLGFQWEFAPGSMLYFTYKNEFLNELTNAQRDYFYYLQNSFNIPQNYTFALKLLYHFDVGSALQKKPADKSSIF